MKIICSIILFLIGFRIDHSKNTVTEVCVSANHFHSLAPINIDKHDIKTGFGLSVRNRDEAILAELNVHKIVQTLVIDKDINTSTVNDFRAVVIIKYLNQKSRTFYIAGTGHIIEGKTVYKPNDDFIDMAYYLFPEPYKQHHIK